MHIHLYVFRRQVDVFKVFTNVQLVFYNENLLLRKLFIFLLFFSLTGRSFDSVFMFLEWLILFIFSVNLVVLKNYIFFIIYTRTVYFVYPVLLYTLWFT